MSDSRAPKADEWHGVLEVLHGLANVMTVRAHYQEGHPAIARADSALCQGAHHVLERLPELVIVLSDGEFVVADRPMPDLGSRIATLASAMMRHDIECIVIQRGIDEAECATLGRALAAQAEAPGRVREAAQARLAHVLLRFVELRSQETAQAEGVPAEELVPAVKEVLDAVAATFAGETLADLDAVRTVARRLLTAASARAYTLRQRCYAPGPLADAEHATNVGLMTAAMMLAARADDALCVEATAAAMLHDVGHFLLPAAVRALPEPRLDDAQRLVFRNHPFAGAWVLLSAGCPPLWVSAALEHHRGVDGGGYPELESTDAPDEVVRCISLASYVDRKRTLLEGELDDPGETLRRALALEPVYFGRSMVARFVAALGLYPPGTTVELSSREVAVVTYASPHDPLRPQVKLVTGPSAGKHVDLGLRSAVEGRHELSVVRAVPAPLMPRTPQLEVVDDDVPSPEAEAPSPEPAPEATPRAQPETPPSRPSIRTFSRPGLRVSEIMSRPEHPAPSFSVPPAPMTVPPERPALEGEDDEAVLALLGGLAAVPVQLRDDLRGIPLDHRAGFVLSLVDGQTALEGIVDMSGMPRSEVLAILEMLVAAGIVKV